MEPENDQAREGESADAFVCAGDVAQQGIVEGLYVLTNKKARTLLNLNRGRIDSGTVCHGWKCNSGNGMDHQLWELKQVGPNGPYRIMSFCGKTFLDLESGKQEDGSKVFACNFVGEGSNRLHQEWIIEKRQQFYTLQCAKTGTYLEIWEGKSDNGIQATCSKWADGDHQLWDLERVSRRTVEIKAIIKSWKPEILSRIFHPHADDNEYFTLLSKLREIIWNETKLLSQSVRKSTFDYDSFVIKAKDAVHTWARDTMRIDGYSVLFGIVFGEAKKGPKAYNWYLSPDMQALVFFDAQTGKEYTSAGLDSFGFEPSLLMF